MRQYALNQLVAAGESDEARLHHAQYFAAIADTVEELLLGDNYRGSIERLNVEHDNLLRCYDMGVGLRKR